MILSAARLIGGLTPGPRRPLVVALVRSGDLMAMWLHSEIGIGRDAAYGVDAIKRCRSGFVGFRSFAPYPQNFPQSVNYQSTASASCSQDVEAVPAGVPLRFRTVSYTPVYDQLRGERINADVPASEAGRHEVDRPGKHRLRDDIPATETVCSPPLEPAGDGAGGWSGLGTGDVRFGKRRLRDDAHATETVCGPSQEPGTDLADGWSWFEPGRLGRADPANATSPVHTHAEVHRHKHALATDQ